MWEGSGVHDARRPIRVCLVGADEAAPESDTRREARVTSTVDAWKSGFFLLLLSSLWTLGEAERP